MVRANGPPADEGRDRVGKVDWMGVHCCDLPRKKVPVLRRATVTRFGAVLRISHSGQRTVECERLLLGEYSLLFRKGGFRDAPFWSK